MNHSPVLPISALAAAVSLMLPVHATTTTIFDEGFSGSTLGSASPAAPTATSTAYQIASSKNATGSSLGSSLNLAMGATSSGFAEMQALFAQSAVTLGAGHSINLSMTFTPTNILLAGTSQTLNVGLYNSGGLGPVPGNELANGGLGTGTTHPTGNVEDWTGYVARIGAGFGDLYTRDPQTETTNEAQDLLFSNAGTGAYDAPAGTVIASTGTAGLALTNGDTYTLTLDISYDGLNIGIGQGLYAGVGTGGTNLYSRTGSAAATATTFDGLAFGFRGTNDALNQSAPGTLGISALTVTHTVPESSMLALLGLGGLSLLRRRRS